jgi:hypothetical protein
VLRPGVSSADVSALSHIVSAASPRLDTLNPFYLWIPATHPATPQPHPLQTVAAFAAVLPPSRGAGGALGVQVAPGTWLPLQRPSPQPSRQQIPQPLQQPLHETGDASAGDAGGNRGGGHLVLVVPISGRRFSVVGAPPAHRTLPSVAASVSDSVRVLRRGGCVEPAVVAVDTEGGIDWVGVPATPACEALCAAPLVQAGGRSSSVGDEFSAPCALLRSHLEVMSQPQGAFAWLPVMDGGRVVLEEVGPEEVGEGAEGQAGSEARGREREAVAGFSRRQTAPRPATHRSGGRGGGRKSGKR